MVLWLYRVGRWWRRHLCWASRGSPSWPGPSPACCSSEPWTCSWYPHSDTRQLRSGQSFHFPHRRHRGTALLALQRKGSQFQISMENTEDCNGDRGCHSQSEMESLMRMLVLLGSPRIPFIGIRRTSSNLSGPSNTGWPRSSSMVTRNVCIVTPGAKSRFRLIPT